MLRRAKGAQRGDHADVAIQVEGEEKRFFFEKRSKKFSLLWAVLVSTPQSKRKQKFFAPLFSKKRLLPIST